MEYTSQEILDGKAVIIEIPQRLDAHISKELKFLISEQLDKQIFNLVIDLKETDFIDSSGLGALVSKLSACRENNGEIILTGLKRKIIEILEITNLDKILTCFESVAEATAHIRQKNS